MPLWKSGEFAVLHAAATPYRARSHFDGQDMLETGGAQHALADGWLNRALAAMDGDGRALGLAVGPEEPLILRGSAKIASWSPEQLLPPVSGDFLERLSDLYRGDSLLGPALAEGMQAEMVSDEVMGRMPPRPRSSRARNICPTRRRVRASCWPIRAARVLRCSMPAAGIPIPARACRPDGCDRPQGPGGEPRCAEEIAAARLAGHDDHRRHRIRPHGGAQRHRRHRSRYRHGGLPSGRQCRGRAGDREMAGTVGRPALSEPRSRRPPICALVFKTVCRRQLGLDARRWKTGSSPTAATRRPWQHCSRPDRHGPGA